MDTRFTSVLCRSGQSTPALWLRAGVSALMLVLSSVVICAEGIVVEIVEPAAGAEVSGMLQVQIQARSDAGPVGRIEVSMGQLSATNEGDSGLISLDAGSLEPGRYEMVAVATDEAGNRGVASVEVEVVARELLRIWLEPERDVVAAGESIRVKAHLSSAIPVAGVQMLLRWDPEKLQLDGGEGAVSPGVALPEGAPEPLVNASIPGQLTVLLISPEIDIAAADTEIAVIAFQALEGAEAGTVAIRWGDGPGDLLVADSAARLVELRPESIEAQITIR